MSDSSDEGEQYNLRDFSEDSDDERPNKRRKTLRQPTLRAKGLGFVSATSQDAQEEEEDGYPDDERPSMGMGSGMTAFQNAFNIGEYSEDVQTESVTPEPDSGTQTPNAGGRGPSAFSANGRIQKSSFAARMMARMGHVEGQGLGKSGQGISAPIQAQLLQSRAGLGHGTTPAKPKPAKREKISQPSTPGSTTTRIKAPPRKRYEVAAIESRGLHIPDTMKSLIVDATGAEARTVTSLSGLSTPTGEPVQTSEASKAAARIKLQLQAYAEAWDATKEHESRLKDEEEQLQLAIELHDKEEQKFLEIVSVFDRVATDDSGEPKEWTQIIQRLQDIQERYSDSIEDLDLPEICSSCLEAPFRRELVDWEPLSYPSWFIDSFTSIGALLELERANRSRHRKKSTPFETLLLAHWFPRIRSVMKEWSIYDPEPAVLLIQSWQSVLPPWLLYKVLHEIILPKLIEGVRRFPKSVEIKTASAISIATSSSRNSKAPDLHSWLFEWWSLLSSDNLVLERFPELRSLVKSKVDSSSWPMWKPLLGSKKQTERTRRPVTTPSMPSTPAAAVMEDVSFKDVVEEWCSENNLMLRSTGSSDTIGRLLYRLQDADRRSKGIRVYLQDDVVFGEDGEPYGLDETLVSRALSK